MDILLDTLKKTSASLKRFLFQNVFVFFLILFPLNLRLSNNSVDLPAASTLSLIRNRHNSVQRLHTKQNPAIKLNYFWSHMHTAYENG